MYTLKLQDINISSYIHTNSHNETLEKIYKEAQPYLEYPEIPFFFVEGGAVYLYLGENYLHLDRLFFIIKRLPESLITKLFLSGINGSERETLKKFEGV